MASYVPKWLSRDLPIVPAELGIILFIHTLSQGQNRRQSIHIVSGLGAKGWWRGMTRNARPCSIRLVDKSGRHGQNGVKFTARLLHA